MAALNQIVFCGGDPEKSASATRCLVDSDFRLISLDDAQGVKQWVARNATDMVIVNLELNSGDPTGLIRHLRENTETGIVALTASGSAIDRIVALEAGADDCLSMPFEPRELLARVRAVMRRQADVERVRNDVLRYVSHIVKFGDCDLDIGTRRLLAANGSEVSVSAMEFALLKIFAENPNRPLHRDELALRTHGRRWSPLDRSLDICISRLRRKVERNPAKPQVILTVRGVGYRFQSAD